MYYAASMHNMMRCDAIRYDVMWYLISLILLASRPSHRLSVVYVSVCASIHLSVYLSFFAPLWQPLETSTLYPSARPYPRYHFICSWLQFLKKSIYPLLCVCLFIKFNTSHHTPLGHIASHQWQNTIQHDIMFHRITFLTFHTALMTPRIVHYYF